MKQIYRLLRLSTLSILTSPVETEWCWLLRIFWNRKDNTPDLALIPKIWKESVYWLPSRLSSIARVKLHIFYIYWLEGSLAIPWQETASNSILLRLCLYESKVYPTTIMWLRSTSLKLLIIAIAFLTLKVI